MADIRGPEVRLQRTIALALQTFLATAGNLQFTVSPLHMVCTSIEKSVAEEPIGLWS